MQDKTPQTNRNMVQVVREMRRDDDSTIYVPALGRYIPAGEVRAARAAYEALPVMETCTLCGAYGTPTEIDAHFAQWHTDDDDDDDATVVACSQCDSGRYVVGADGVARCTCGHAVTRRDLTPDAGDVVTFIAGHIVTVRRAD